MAIHTAPKEVYKMNMKSLFGVAVILVSTPCAHAYIDENPMGRQSSPFSVTDWSPKTFAPKIRIVPMGEPAPPARDDEINVDATAHGIIRREYGAWTKRYGKERTDQRFQIFKRNFVKQMEMNRKNGEFFLLNEYGDLTEKEYLQHLQTKENKQDEIDESEDTHVWQNSGETLPAAPVKSIEDLTQEVLQSAMKASRESVAEEQQEVMKTKKSMYSKMLAGITIQQEKSLSPMVYTYLLDATKEKVARKLHQNTFQSKAFPGSYIDFVNVPMQEQDDFVLLPTLVSAAITSSSYTIQPYLIEEEEEENTDLGWDTYAYAFSFDDNEEYYYE